MQQEQVSRGVVQVTIMQVKRSRKDSPAIPFASMHLTRILSTKKNFAN